MGIVNKVLPEAQLGECRDNTEATIRELTLIWHQEGVKTLNYTTLGYVQALYKLYMDYFADTPDAQLTLTTCNPKFSARERLVIKADLVPALEEMINYPGPYVLDVEVPYQEHVLPMIPSGHTVRDMIKE